jgi:D-alanyl-D-alanine-carboxypeptidase/D-alanyl-D-alanine-endopeptidase
MNSIRRVMALSTSRVANPAIWCLLLAVLINVPTAAPAQSIEISDEVKSSIRARVDNGYNVGIIVGVVDQQGTRYFSYGETEFGNGITPDENSVFEIGSISKVFTSILLADMIARGEVKLDDPIQLYLPDGVTAPTRSERSITPYDLATHTSGLPRMPNNFSPADATNPYADYTVAQMYEFLDGYTLRRDIGSQYEYSNFGAGLLGNLLASAAGMTYEDLIEQRITSVLGMDDTSIELTPDQQRRLATGHVGTMAVPNWDIPALAGAGALRSTTADMLEFVAANAGLEETRLHAVLSSTHEPRETAGAPSMQIGLGWHIRSGEGVAAVWHNGGTGGYRSFAGFVQDGNTGVVVLTNSNRSTDDIGFHLLNPSFPLGEVRAMVQVAPEVLRRYVGEYELTPALIFDVQLEGERLTVQLTGQSRLPVYAESDTKFFYTVVDAQITFEVDERGEVAALVLHQNGMDQRARRR